MRGNIPTPIKQNTPEERQELARCGLKTFRQISAIKINEEKGNTAMSEASEITLYMPLLTNDFHLKTKDLKLAEVGVYIRLLTTMWEMEAVLPDDDQLLAEIAGLSKKEWIQKYRQKMKKLFSQEKEYWLSDNFAVPYDRFWEEHTTENDGGNHAPSL